MLYKNQIVSLLAGFCALAGLARSADTVELKAGKITGTVSLSSEVIQGGSIYVYATDGSGASGSASLSGSTYTVLVPGGKTWRANLNLYLQTASGSSSYFYISPADQIPVSAEQTVTKDFTIPTARITANVLVSNGTLTNVASLQTSAYSGTTSFSASSQNQAFVVALPTNNTSISGTATVKSTTNQSSTQTLSHQTLNVSVSGATATWSVDAAFSAGSIAGSFNLTGAVSPNSTTVYLYNSNWTNIGANSFTGNGSFQYGNLMAGTYNIYGYAHYNTGQLQYNRQVGVTAGNVTNVNFADTVALGQTSVEFTGFLTRAKISSGSFYGNWVAPSPNPDNRSLSSYASLGTSGFTSVVTPGNWTFYQYSFSGQDTSSPGDYFYYNISAYDAARANTQITFAAGDSKTLPALSVETTQTELTFDVIESAGATAETKISYPSVNGYVNLYGPNGSWLGQRSFNAANYGTPQAKPRVRIIGIPGTYMINAYGTVDGSQVSFGNFSLELKTPLITPVGTNVAVAPGAGVSLKFDNVTTAGVTTAAQLPVGPALPPGYSGLTAGGQKVYYSASTSASFTGSVEITVAYDAASVPVTRESALRLFYYDNAAQKWIDITIAVDTANNKVTGVAPALTLFALGLSHAPVITSITAPVDGLKGTALAFSAAFTDSDPGEKHTASWSWGDGSASTAGIVNQAAGTVTGTHTFASAGTYTGQLSLTDITGNVVTKSFSVTVVGGGDNIAPTITVPANVTAEATGPNGSTVTFSASANDETDGNVAVTLSPLSGSLFPLGTTTVTATAKDAANNVASKTFTVTVHDKTAPAIAVQAPIAAEATSAAGAVVTFSPSATDAVSTPTVTTVPASGSTFASGVTTVTITATDAAGNTTTGAFTVTVVDTTAPTFSSLTASSTSLWPANHKMVAITLNAVASDAVSAVTTKIVSATSNEPDNGLGDGDTAGDIAITGAMTLDLRAERSGSGNGRIYTITVEAKDAAGNKTLKTVTVSVAKSQGGK